MSKAAEQAYLRKLGDAGREHSKNKPFSDNDRGVNLVAIGAMLSLLPPPPGRLLDLGCGGGWTSVFFARSGYEVVGQDISQDMIGLAEENAARTAMLSISFRQGDYETAAFHEEFDCAVFFDSLHHAEDEAAALRCAFAALRPGGVLLTLEPGEGHSIHPNAIEAVRLYGVSERDMPPHLINRRGQEAGFVPDGVFPSPHVLVDFFYRRRPPPPSSPLAAVRHALRALKLAFGRRKRESAIVRLVKPR
jgi:SAM-dependent methyltransferase